MLQQMYKEIFLVSVDWIVGPMTQILIRLHLCSLDTLLHNARISFDKQCSTSSNCLIQYLAQLMSYAGF